MIDEFGFLNCLARFPPRQVDGGIDGVCESSLHQARFAGFTQAGILLHFKA